MCLYDDVPRLPMHRNHRTNLSTLTLPRATLFGVYQTPQVLQRALHHLQHNVRNKTLRAKLLPWHAQATIGEVDADR